MKMQQHKILTWTLLILSIINFAPAAPVAVRERPEVRIDATVTRNGTATSQKRWDPDDGELPLPNVPNPLPPPSPDSTDILSQNPVAEQRMTDNARRPPGAPDNPGPSTGPRLPVGSTPVAGSLLPPPESWSPNAPGPAHAPPQSQDSTHWSERVSPPPQWPQKFDSLPPSTPPKWSQRVGLPPGPPSTPGPSQWSQKVGPPPPSAPPPPRQDLTGLSQYQRMRIMFGLDPMPLRALPPRPYSTHWSGGVAPNPGATSGSGLPVGSMPAQAGSTPMIGSHSLPPERLSLLNIPGAAPAPPKNMYSIHWSQRVGPPPRPPPQWSQKSDPLPTPLQSPGADPETHTLVNPDPFLAEFRDNLLKGKIKPRMSRSDAVASEQEDPR